MEKGFIFNQPLGGGTGGMVALVSVLAGTSNGRGVQCYHWFPGLIDLKITGNSTRSRAINQIESRLQEEIEKDTND